VVFSTVGRMNMPNVVKKRGCLQEKTLIRAQPVDSGKLIEKRERHLPDLKHVLRLALVLAHQCFNFFNFGRHLCGEKMVQTYNAP